MVDRQDIDALLVGALYGELTPAEEARLAAHLESHPADRTALEDLKTARQAVRESKVFDIQQEPPQAISALLLQEAHRRAPRPAREREDKESWFARLARSFLAHPALAAAAMLVLVVGVAGTLYLKKGNDESAFKQAVTESASNGAPAVSATPPAGPQQAEPETTASAGSGSSIVVGLAEDEKKPMERQQEAAPGGMADKAEAVRADPHAGMQKLDTKPAPATRRSAPSKPSIVVTTPQLAPKELDQPRAKAAAKNNFSRDAEDIGGLGDNAGIATGTGGGTRGSKDSASVNATVATTPRNAPAAPAPVAQAPAPQAAPPPPPAVAKAPSTAPTQGAPPKSDVMARAQELLGKAIVAAKGDRCHDAASYAKQILALAPAFYEQNVADNRELKGCLQLINNATAAERAKKHEAPRPTETAK